MNRSSLVPKTITDKNGVVTTRWVKPDTGHLSMSKVPAPSSAPAPLSTPLLDERFQASLLGMGGEVSLEDFDPEARRIVESLIARSESNPFAKGSVTSLVGHSFDAIEGSGTHDLTSFNNVAALGEAVAFSGGITDLPINMYINGLDQFVHINDFHTEATEDELVKARALCRLTAALPDEYLDSYMGYSDQGFDAEDYEYEISEDADSLEFYIKLHPRYEGLADLVMKYPSNVDEIAAVIKKRKSADAGMLEQVITHKEAALKEGTL